MSFDRRVHGPVVRILHFRHGEPERPQRGANKRHVIMRIFERSDFGVVDLVADQQCDTCFCPQMRRQQNKQQNNDRGPQHVHRPP
jgi:hypothetical protein